MASDLQQRLAEKSAPVSFEKSMGLLTATTMGVGSLMGAGLYVLVGIAAAAAGPGMWIAYAVCGVLTFLSVLMFADFSKRLPVSGGGYLYAYRQLGSFWGFIVGWHLAVGSVFACALYAYGFASYAGSFFPYPWATSAWFIKGVAIGLVILLTLLGLRGGQGGARLQHIFTWGNLLVLLVLVAVALPQARAGNFTPALPNGVAGVGAAISLIYISFFGYQLIANSAEEVTDAERTVGRAMVLSLTIAFGFYLLVAVVAVAAVPWRELAASEAPLVLVAQSGVGKWGAWLIGVGGVLAAGAALNGTLLSQGRQIYAMGRDRLLPERLGSVSETTHLPVVAILGGAVFTCGVLLLADLAFIAKAANFALLFSMLPISVALHTLYRQREETDPVVPTWRRVVPWAALLANTGLLLTLDWQSLLFGGMVVAAGCVVFLSYSYSSEKRGQAGFSVALSDDRSFSLLRRGERILVPMSNPRTQESLFSICQSLLPPGGGEVVVLSVVLADKDRSPREMLGRASGTHEAVGVLERITAVAEAQGVTFRPVVRAAKSLAEGISHAAQEEHCQLIVMGWATQDDGSPSRLLEDVIAQVHSNIIFLQLSKDVPPRRIGVSLGGRANLPLMVRVASTLAETYGGEVVYLNIMPQYYKVEHHRHARQIQIEAISRHTSLVPFRTEILVSDNPLGALVERSRDLDLLVVGSAQRGPLQSGAVGSFSTMVAEQAHCSVVIARVVPSLGRIIAPGMDALRELGADVIGQGQRKKSGETE